MSPITIKLDDVDAWEGGGPLPDGQYVCRIDNAEEGTSSGGHDQLEVTFRVSNGDFAGYTTRDWLVITPKTLGKIRAFLEAAGITIPAGDFDLPTSRLPGRPVQITVRQRENQGKMRTEVIGYAAVEGAHQAMNGGATQTSTSRHDSEIPF